ncbi:MAG: DUF3990 domain-containing protein [Candidatus Ancillula sp.]|jgi:hypothetical protein|nr:DUF3990 domain-containing protein [Candidatus Ancillula sp.]
MKLYHASDVEIDVIDLSKCQKYKDFGQGFYLTELQKQSENWVKTVLRRKYGKQNDKIGYVTIFEMSDNAVDSLKNKHFDKPTIEWMRFILANRDREFSDFGDQDNNQLLQYDIVEGPVANDGINATLNLYLSGTVSETALLERLGFADLNHQISFHSERAVSILEKVGVYEVK